MNISPPIGEERKYNILYLPVTTSICYRHYFLCNLWPPGHPAWVPLPGPPLPHLPALHLSRLLRHLRPDGSVRAGECGRGCFDEASGGEQQGGTAGGDGGAEGEGGEEGEGGGGKQASEHRVPEWSAGAELGCTCSGRACCVDVVCGRVEVDLAEVLTLETTSCGRFRSTKRSCPTPRATCWAWEAWYLCPATATFSHSDVLLFLTLGTRHILATATQVLKSFMANSITERFFFFFTDCCKIAASINTLHAV